MPDLISIIEKWWKLIAGLTIVNVILSFLILLFIPKQYLSTVTALPASSFSADKEKFLMPICRRCIQTWATLTTSTK